MRILLPALIDQIDEWHTNPNALRGLATGFTDFDARPAACARATS